MFSDFGILMPASGQYRSLGIHHTTELPQYLLAKPGARDSGETNMNFA